MKDEEEKKEESPCIHKWGNAWMEWREFVAEKGYTTYFKLHYHQKCTKCGYTRAVD